MQTPSKLHAAVIGLGIGEFHAEIYDTHQGVELDTICDLNNVRLEEIHLKHPKTKTTTEAEKILTDSRIDIVSICSYDDMHAEQILMAAKYNKHIFVEKPLCLTKNELEQITHALEKNKNISLSSNFVLRTFPIFKELKQKISAQDLGEIYCVEGDYNYGRLEKLLTGWRGKTPQYSISHGGGIHLIDLITWLTDLKVNKVCSISSNIASRKSEYPGCDTMSSIIEFTSGAIGKVCSNYASFGPHHHALRVFGTKGSFFYDGQSAYYYYQRDNKSSAPIKHISTRSLKANKTEKSEILHSFIEYLLFSQKPSVTTSEVLESMNISLAIEQSRIEERWISVL